MSGNRNRPGWTLALVSLALFMVTLDNLVVTTALPTIRVQLHTGLDSLEWTVNAYTLSFAVLLITGAALGDRFGRRRMFIAGLSIFTLGSAAAALSPSAAALIAARALQGVGGALVMPLTLTLLSESFPAGRRGIALGIWSGISGLGVALGPVIGGAVVTGISWHWIFWLNVPVGLVVIPLAALRLTESRGPARRFDIPGVLLATAGLFGVVYGLVRANALGWGSATVLGSMFGGAALLASFVVWELRSPEPMLPMRFFRNRAFSATSAVSYTMYFGMFGSVFLLAQFFQTAQHYTALGAGLRTLPWTGMPMLVAPVAGILSDRLGSRPLMATGLALQAAALMWISAVLSPTTPYGEFIVPFILAGTGMAHGVRPRRQCGAVGGAARGGGPGLRCQQHHPRDRWRLRRRGPGDGLRQRRRLRDPAALRERAAPRGAGRQRGAGRGCDRRSDGAGGACPARRKRGQRRQRRRPAEGAGRGLTRAHPSPATPSGSWTVPSGTRGIACSRTPQASATALAMAGATPTIGVSPRRAMLRRKRPGEVIGRGTHPGARVILRGQGRWRRPFRGERRPTAGVAAMRSAVGGVLDEVRETLIPSRRSAAGALPLLLVGMTALTGLVDAFSYLTLGHVFVANMTGNVVFLGFALAGVGGFSIGTSLLAIGAFMVGAFAAAVLRFRVEHRLDRQFGLAGAIQVVLLAGALVISLRAGTSPAGTPRYLLIAILAVAMGVQNATARGMGVADLTTTVLTMTITGIAADVRAIGGGGARAGRRLISVAAMLLGAIVGAVLILRGQGSLPLGLALILAAVIAACSPLVPRTKPG